MKNLVLILISIYTTSVSCQTNDLPESVYNTIRFDNVLLTDIINSKGNTTTIQSLIPVSFNINSGEDPGHWKEYESNSIYLLFQDGEQFLTPNNIQDYQLTNIKLFDNSKSLFINGIYIKVGDNISLLGNPSILTYSDGTKRIVYKLGSEVIRISFSEINNEVSLIEYEYYN
ncbi:hypothetical protein BST92_05500 [Nonlabens arenilitoris]|uniref:Uncharacterized protein n=1 Tax=Nonlabens arenilitoris TaxID=1217969 RepID=A0A2S7U8Z9_9FLAO|nr:hypothetical protein [Nonlabens arenilitoris]PQJ31408.1 hypothetical protein BST92_05500 [Nonlabens arenilitoris]